jgi:hypothetical protein
MMPNRTARVYTRACLAAMALLAVATTAHAQYKPRPLNDPATGESYHIEGSASLWFPTADMVVSSESLGIKGTDINFKTDLGLTDQRFPALKLVLRPSKRNKFRLEFIPIKYDQSGTLKRDIVFNGQKYAANLPVNSTLDWKAYRFAYEFDVVSNNRGFFGLVLEAKYTDVGVQLAAPVSVCQNNVCAPLNEFAHARAPIPAVGGIARVYVVPNISITGEITGFKLPSSLIKNTEAHYFDFDIYGTLNFTNALGVQAGYRSLDVGYLLSSDTGSFTLKGPYVGIVARY